MWRGQLMAILFRGLSNYDSDYTRDDTIFEAFEEFEYDSVHAKSLRPGYGYIWELVDDHAFMAASNKFYDNEFQSKIDACGLIWYGKCKKWSPEYLDAYQIFEKHKTNHNNRISKQSISRLYPYADLSDYVEPLTKEEFAELYVEMHGQTNVAHDTVIRSITTSGNYTYYRAVEGERELAIKKAKAKLYRIVLQPDNLFDENGKIDETIIHLFSNYVSRFS